MLKYFSSLSLITSSSLMAGVNIVTVPIEVEEVSEITSLADAFKQGTVSGQIRVGYIHSTPQKNNITDPKTTATALGGQLKYETATLYGFSAAAALYTSHTISGLSADEAFGEFNEDFGNTHYDLLAEAYMNYKYNDFNIRVGRQLIDTPYADSDDIRMTPNTFQATIATYTMNNVTFMAGYLTQWQGPDAESFEFNRLMPGSDGTAMLSAAYSENNIEAGAWFYNVDNIMNIYYGDIAYTHQINDSMSLRGAVQIGHQEEINNSLHQGTLYGAMAALDVSGFTFGFAYDHTEVKKGKQYFTGFGGGVGFVNMFEMTATTLTLADSVTSWKGSIAYDFSTIGMEGLSASYDYGDFQVEEFDVSATEQNFILAYAPTDEWDLEVIYALIEDKIFPNFRRIPLNRFDHSFDTVLVRANYNF